jgi:pumilio family protein 6
VKAWFNRSAWSMTSNAFAFQMVYAHDTVRVMQCFIEYGNELQRDTVFNELKDEFVALAKSQYARFVLDKFLNYG